MQRYVRRPSRYTMKSLGEPLQVTVRPMLRDSCPVCPPVCVSVTLVYCGQTVGWIKMPLGAEVGLGQRDVVLDRDSVNQSMYIEFVFCALTLLVGRQEEHPVFKND